MEGRHERSAVYEIRRGQRNEGAANLQCRAEELADGTNAFGDEKTMSLPRVTAL
jgi:hypothetical protein